jgi:hypothetical protein
MTTLEDSYSWIGGSLGTTKYRPDEAKDIVPLYPAAGPLKIEHFSTKSLSLNNCNQQQTMSNFEILSTRALANLTQYML